MVGSSSSRYARPQHQRPRDRRPLLRPGPQLRWEADPRQLPSPTRASASSTALRCGARRRQRHVLAAACASPAAPGPARGTARAAAGALSDALGQSCRRARRRAPPGPPSGRSSPTDRLIDEFGPGPFAPIVLAIRTDGPAVDPANLERLYEYSRRLGGDARIQRVDSLVNVDPRLTLDQYELLYRPSGRPPDRFVSEVLGATTRDNLTAFTVTTPYGPNETAARELVRDLRAGAGPLAPPAGMRVLVGGGAADVEDVVTGIAAEFPRTAAFILVTTYLVLLLLLRSVLLPLKALAMNSLSVLASFGALVWIFQDGNLSAVFGTRPLGFVETTQPVILFCVLFGLSMDYEVFLLSRMREAWEATGDNPTAVAHGLERSGRIVTSAALIVIVVAGSFAFADIVLIKALGVGIAIAVALDATVVRALLVPATMRLLGKWNWWLPGSLARRLPLLEEDEVPA